MSKGKLILMGCGIALWLVSCNPSRRESLPKTEIGTFDILLDYDQENGTNLAKVYRNAMDILYETELRGEKLVELTDTVDGRIIHIFGTRHFSRLAIIRFLRSVLPFIQNPKEWVFLIEGSTERTLILPEVYFLTGAAKELGIPTYDPIVSPLGEEVTKKLIRGTPPMVTLKDVHFALFDDLFPAPESLHTLTKKERTRYVSVIASYSLLPADSIEALLVEYDTTYLCHPLKLNASKRVFTQIRNDMIDTSNVLSRIRLEEDLDTIMQAKYIFVCVGSYHVPVFENLDSLLDNLHEVHLINVEGKSPK